ncbi:MAG: 3'-5' exonuclease, partial [Oscillospiraceae bacterium]
SLYTDLDSLNSADDSVIMMTMHSAKGLEFKSVFIIGMEEGIFPSFRSISSDAELEEERRLAYVALTRAKENLYITNCEQRMLFGSTSRNKPSRFINEIPFELTNYVDDTINSKINRGFAPTRVKEPPVITKEMTGVGIKPQADVVSLDFAVGDKVNHKIFGTGLVVSIMPIANDNLVEISFDKVGTKKIMANFAKLKKS